MSTQKLDLVPNINDLKRICLAIATLELFLDINWFIFESKTNT
jgi:hypothetical protein